MAGVTDGKPVYPKGMSPEQIIDTIITLQRFIEANPANETLIDLNNSLEQLLNHINDEL